MKSKLLIEMARYGWRLVDRETTPTGFSKTDFSLLGNYRTLTEAQWLFRELKGYGHPKVDYLDTEPRGLGTDAGPNVYPLHGFDRPPQYRPRNKYFGRHNG